MHLKESILDFLNTKNQRNSSFENENEPENIDTEQDLPVTFQPPKTQSSKTQKNSRQSYTQTRSLNFYVDKFKQVHLQALNSNSKKSNLSSTILLKQKYFMAKNFMCTLLLTDIFLTLACYELQTPDNSQNLSLVITTAVLSFLRIIIYLIWVLTLFIWHLLEVAKFDVPNSSNFVRNFGVFNFVFLSIAFFIFPNAIFGGTKIQAFPEIYYLTNHQTTYFTRNLLEFFMIAGLFFDFFFIFKIFIENISLNWQTNLRFGKNGQIRVSFKKQLKIAIDKFKLFSVVFFIVYFVSFFLFSLKIAEQPKSMQVEFQTQMSLPYHSYFNIFWDVVQVFTTVGFSGVNVQTLFGRFILYATGLTGLFTLNLTICLVLDFFEFTDLENQAFKVFNKLKLSQQIRETAVCVISFHWKLFKISGKLKTLKREKLRWQLGQSSLLLKELVNRQVHLNFKGNPQDELGDEFYKVERDMDLITGFLENQTIDLVNFSCKTSAKKTR